MNKNLVPVRSTSTFSFLLRSFRQIMLDAKIAYYTTIGDEDKVLIFEIEF